jgi:hypothetical protein
MQKTRPKTRQKTKEVRQKAGIIIFYNDKNYVGFYRS